MKARLNITVDPSLLQYIKLYVSEKDTSISKIVEDYFYLLIEKEVKKDSIFDFLENVKSGDYSEDFDFKSKYYEELAEKHEH